MPHNSMQTIFCMISFNFFCGCFKLLKFIYEFQHFCHIKVEFAHFNGLLCIHLYKINKHKSPLYLPINRRIRFSCSLKLTIKFDVSAKKSHL